MPKTLQHSKCGLTGLALTGMLLLISIQNVSARPWSDEFGPGGGPAMTCHDRSSERMPGGAYRPFEGGMPPVFLPGVDLTEDQQEQVFKLMHAQALEMHDKGREVRKAREALRELTESGDYTEAKARPLADTLGKRTEELALLTAKTGHEIYSLLTAEQRKQVAGQSSKLRPE